MRALLANLKKNIAFSGYDYKTSHAGSGGAPTAYSAQHPNNQSLNLISLLAFLTWFTLYNS